MRRRFAMVVTGVTLAPLACAPSGTASEAYEARARELEWVDRLRLDLDEVSGLALAPDGVLHAVGDAARRIAAIDPFDGVQLDDVLEGDDVPSQWEAIAVDGDGRAFVLDEHRDLIEVFDDGQRTHVLALELSDELMESWQHDSNSRGEGLVLLANGHVLVAKEKNPPLVIEFGPAGHDAEGYVPELALGDAFFPITSGSLMSLHHWELHDELADELDDLSELAVGPGGRLFALSDESRALVQLERELSPDENKIEARAWYDLPSKVKKPEGLAFVGRWPIIAVDNDDDAHDLFWLSRVAEP